MNKEEIDKALFGIGVNSFNRFRAFLNMSSHLKGENYWYALRNGYATSDNLYGFSGIIKDCFLKKEPHRDSIMESDEIAYFNNLPEQITIYRGMTENELIQQSFGCSWTLKKDVADFFANDYRRNMDTNHLKKVVHEITINKNEAIAFFNSREEFEIIYIKDRSVT